MILPRCTRYDNPVGLMNQAPTTKKAEKQGNLIPLELKVDLMNQAPTDESSPYDKKAEKIQDKEKLGF